MTESAKPSCCSYEQIGLNFKLCAAEILFNEGLAYLGMQQADQGMQLLDRARREKQVDEHEIMEEAYINYGKNCTVFSVPTGMCTLW